jgi:O-succinylbenzoic acid--CoA ligase
MTAHFSGGSLIRLETHFGDRVMPCYADRPPDTWALFEQAVAAHGDAEALVDGPLRLTWRQLAAQADEVAAGFARAGVRPGDRVGLLAGNRSAFVTTVAGLLRLGAIAVPMGTRLQTPEIAYILSHCGAVGLVHDEELASRLPAAADVPALAHRWVEPPREPSAPAIEQLPARPAVSEEDTAFILYTSGTTGRPKGAMLTHLNVVHSVLHFRETMGLTTGERSLLAVPASHVTGLVAILLAMSAVGGCTVLMAEFKAPAFVALAERERITHTVMVPAMYNLALMQPAFASADLSAWRIGGYGGAPMPEATIAALADRLPGLGLINAYGATESTSPATLLPAALAAVRPDSVGLALPCAELRVMDAHGREVPPGEPGEIWIRGPMVVPGYWDNPEATRSSFCAGFWKSGDIGSIDKDGFVRVFDRLKDMLNRGGYKVFSVEVENVLAACPGVVESAIIGKPCPVLGERVHAFVSRSDPALDEAQLRAFCAARLADYKVPESFTLTQEPLPRNANGKLLKRVMREQLQGSAAG